MPSPSPDLTAKAAETLASIGEAVRLRRKSLRISAVAAAEAAGISRVTQHRLEKGEPSVTMGAYMAALAVLGLNVHVAPEAPTTAPAVRPSRKGWIPARVRIADYPMLKTLAWQVHGTPELTPREALGIYERNWRHVDAAALSEEERDLVEALRQGLGSETLV